MPDTIHLPLRRIGKLIHSETSQRTNISDRAKQLVMEIVGADTDNDHAYELAAYQAITDSIMAVGASRGNFVKLNEAIYDSAHGIEKATSLTRLVNFSYGL